MTQDYHADTSRIGKSGLDLIHQSPLHYWAAYLDPNREHREQTPAMLMGSVVHQLVLEPHKRDYAPMPDVDRRTTAGKEAYARAIAANPLAQLVPAKTWDTANRMADAVHRNKAAMLLLEGGEMEKRVDWTEPTTGAQCKSKLDCWNPKHGFIVDLKTADDGSEEGFGRSAYNYRYHVQSAFYTDALVNNNITVERFYFIVVEKEAPFAVSIYYADNDVIEKGRQAYLTDLFLYEQCRASNKWPGYSSENTLQTALKMPAWAK